LKTDQRRTIRRSVHLCVALVLITGLTFSGCKSAKTIPAGKGNVTGPAAAVQTTTYQGVGVVQATDAKRPSIEIDHEEIKGLMPAMSMEFYVKDKSLLGGLKPGDRVEFTIENGVGGIKITEIRRL
jgi:Cu/Ag efflux protein CusF